MPRTKRNTPTQKPDPAQAITDEIIALLEAGTVPWSQPWRSVGQPLRHCGTPYRGINAFLLGLQAGLKGYGSPYWMMRWTAAARAGTLGMTKPHRRRRV